MEGVVSEGMSERPLNRVSNSLCSYFNYWNYLTTSLLLFGTTGFIRSEQMIQKKARCEITVDTGVDHRQSHMHKKNKHKCK